MKSVPTDQILSFLNCPAYFDLMKLPHPENRSKVLEKMHLRELIAPSDGGGYDISNSGLFFSRKLEDFDGSPEKRIESFSIVETAAWRRSKSTG